MYENSLPFGVTCMPFMTHSVGGGENGACSDLITNQYRSVSSTIPIEVTHVLKLSVSWVISFIGSWSRECIYLGKLYLVDFFAIFKERFPNSLHNSARAPLLGLA